MGVVGGLVTATPAMAGANGFRQADCEQVARGRRGGSSGERKSRDLPHRISRDSLALMAGRSGSSRGLAARDVRYARAYRGRRIHRAAGGAGAPFFVMIRKERQRLELRKVVRRRNEGGARAAPLGQCVRARCVKFRKCAFAEGCTFSSAAVAAGRLDSKARRDRAIVRNSPHG